MKDLTGTGRPKAPIMRIKRIGPSKEPTKVRDTRWSNSEKPYNVYPYGKTKMHCSSELHYFYEIGKTVKKGNIINLGVGKGYSTNAFAWGIKQVGGSGHVYGIDLYNHVREMTKERLEQIYESIGIGDYIKLYKGFTCDWANKLDIKCKCLLIDADHHYETCKNDFELWSPKIELDGLLIFHDANFNTVNRVIEELDPYTWKLEEHIGATKSFRRIK